MLYVYSYSDWVLVLVGNWTSHDKIWVCIS